MDDIFDFLGEAAKTAGSVASGLNAANATANQQAAVAAAQAAAVAPVSSKTLYIIGGVLVAALVAVLALGRRK